MGILGRLDSRLIINGSISVLALLAVALAARMAHDAYKERAAAQRLLRINDLADRTIELTVRQAVERGLTSSALAVPGPLAADARQIVVALRGEIDSRWREVVVLADAVAHDLGPGHNLRRVLDQASAAYGELERARQRADAALDLRADGIEATEWIAATTRFIAAAARLRDVAVAATSPAEESVRLYLAAKREVWTAAEHAGLERGVLVYYVSARRPVPPARLGELRSHRVLVERSIAAIRELGAQPSTDARVREAIALFERDFVGRYEVLRTQVYDDARHGRYALSGARWFEAATAAIDSILAVMSATSQVTQERARAIATDSLHAFIAHLGLLAAAFAMAVFGMVRVTRTANELFHEKELAEVTLHSIGDAVVTTDADLRIEYLNPVAEELTGWISAEAKGRPLTEVFRIVNGLTREPHTNPAERCLRERRVVGLDHNSTLIHRDGKEYAIEDSAAPVRDRDGNIVGTVMVFYDVTKTRNLGHLLSYQAAHDTLTGLVNRREFERRLAPLLEQARAEGKHHALCYIDLDLFKIVNDTAGHAAGDKLLRLLAQKLKDRVRDGDTVARLGGDEFGVLLESCPLDRAKAIAEGLRQAIRDFRFAWQDRVFEVGASIGLVPITPESASLAEVMSEADAACYAAKDKGRDRVQIYQPDNAELARRQGEMQWVTRIQRALAEDRLRLYVQPVRALQGQRSGLRGEFLVRLLDEQGALVLPGAFLPAAERYNLMPAVDRWVIGTALAGLKRRAMAGELAAETYAINVSGASLCDERFLAFVLHELDTHALEPAAVCFEITESVAVSNLEQAMGFIQALKQRGCRFALDDFGSGMSSYAYLKNLPVNYLKIAGSFVRQMLHSPVDRAMVESFNRLGHVMGIHTVAESVESEETMALLADLGVDYAQGFAIARPRAADELLH